jgi:XTP/dITP diphosphohydrolase
MTLKKEIYYATGNPVKFAEVEKFFEKYPEIELKQFKGEISEIQSDNQREIAILKAEQAWEILKKPVLVDDSGIFFHKYKNFPGTFTKYVYQSLGMKNLEKLYDVGDAASFQLNLVFYYASGNYVVFEQKSEGTLVKFDEYKEDVSAPFEFTFIPKGVSKTYTQLRESGEVDKYKYRLHALKKFMDWYLSMSF